MKCFIIYYFLLNSIIEMEQTNYTTTNTQSPSWVDYNPLTEAFPIENIPFGVGTFSDVKTNCVSRIADQVIDLAYLEQEGYFKELILPITPVFNKPDLNSFIERGRQTWKLIRQRIQEIFKKGSEFENDEKIKNSLTYMKNVKMVLPVKIQDYTDFYSSKNHAFNLGRIIRGEADALQPNWVHLPVGYHGRSSTIVVDGTEIKRPRGQIKPPKSQLPLFSESKRLDYEVEVGVIVGKSNEMGTPIKIKDAQDYVFGLVLLNDWSARDIQTWEYVPLGPFNAKNFATTISPWVITLEALEPFRVDLPQQDPQPLPYLFDPSLFSWDIPINVSIRGKNQENSNQISTTNYKYMYWTIKQQIAHHTVTGCKLNVGDLLGSGTISGTDPNSYGCLFEMNLGGTQTLKVGEEVRTWLDDGDYVNFNALVKGDGFNIGFGDCGGKILPANPEEDYY